MKQFCAKIFFIIFIFFSFLLINNSVIAEPVVEEIITEPVNPTHKSTFTVTAKITGEDVSSVNIIITECNDEVCIENEEYEMNQNDAGEWVAEPTLQDSSGASSFIKYEFEIIDNGEEYNIDEGFKVDIKAEPKDNNDDNGSPGFEMIVLLAAILLAIILLRKKRL